MLAAACTYALDQHVHRLAEDHAHAQLIATACADAAPTAINPSHVDTNIVPLQLDDTGWSSAAEFVAAARGEGVLVSALGPRFVRLVTHLEIDDAAAKQAADVLARLLAYGPA